MKAKYIGYPGDKAEESPLYVTHLGVTFRRDRWATLPEKIDPVQFEKLKNHPHFEVAEGEGEDLPAEEAAPASNSGDGPKQGKAELIAKLSAIANTHPDVEFDPKWSVAKLTAALEAAEFEHGDD